MPQIAREKPVSIIPKGSILVTAGANIHGRESYALDDVHLLAAARYIELNPVKSKLCAQPEDYFWSGAAFPVNEKNDPLVKDALLSWPRSL
jgi:hypothetical protein